MTEDVLIPLIREARSFTTSTKQREICTLTGKVAEASLWNPSYKQIGILQHILSSALEKIYCGMDWFPEFTAELDKLCQTI